MAYTRSSDQLPYSAFGFSTMRYADTMDAGSRYVFSPLRIPQCRHTLSQWSELSPTLAKGCPRRTDAPTPMSVMAGSKVKAMSPYLMLTTSLPATFPVNETIPSPGARISSPVRVCRSTPRCPESHGCAGPSYAFNTLTGLRNGQSNTAWQVSPHAEITATYPSCPVSASLTAAFCRISHALLSTATVLSCPV